MASPDGQPRVASQPGSVMAAISLTKVQKSFGATHVIKGVDLEIAQGEFVVFVGPSGCGKSTLLRMIAGLESVTGGDIAIAGQVVNDHPPRARDIAMVFQDYALYPHMSVFDNIAFALRYRGVGRAELRRRVEDAARILEITPLLERMPRQLSGGQRQRVAMGRAIVRNPKVFLFDEPLSNLDAKLRVTMRTEIKALRERVPVTTIYVTHDQVEAMTLGDRIVVLDHGVIQQVGTPEEVYDCPATTFVAGFIGAPPMNLLPAHLARGDGRTQVVLADGVRLAVAGGAGLGHGTAVTIGIRPEHFEWAGAGEPSMLETAARLVEPLGSDTLVMVTIGGHDVQARLAPKRVRRAGDPVRLTVAAEHIHLFDGAGRRIAT